MRFGHWIFAEKTRFVIINFLEMLLFQLKEKFSVYFLLSICQFLSQKRLLTFLLSYVT